MSLVSIVLPTYNRADVIERAIASVRAQGHADWELIVVDDGSTDGTCERIEGCDPRLRLVRQENQGTAGARNTALRLCKGDYVAFLDSDDAWLPHHLELCVRFLEAHPGEAFVTNELWEDLGDGRIVKHYRVEIGWYARTARELGSALFRLPEGERDDHLRLYRTRHEIGDWGREIVARTPYEDVFHYQGRIFEHLRFGFLMCLQPTVLRREAREAVGFFDPRYYGASDYGFAIELCRRFPANYLSLPACIKHELAADGSLLAEDHVATGKTGLICLQDMLGCLEQYWAERLDEPEVALQRGLLEQHVGRVALARGERALALRHLEAAWRHNPGLTRARNFYFALRLLPGERLACDLLNGVSRASGLAARLARRETTFGELARKLTARLRRA
jgi:glycosyltransferase involved in cell wall biosynthesis